MEFFPQDHGYYILDEIYYVDKSLDSVIAEYSDPKMKYLSLGDMVAGVRPISKKKNKYEIVLYQKFTHHEITSYTWPFHADNGIIEITEHIQSKGGINYLIFGYFNAKDKFVQLGYLNKEDWIFKKKVKDIKY